MNRCVNDLLLLVLAAPRLPRGSGFQHAFLASLESPRASCEGHRGWGRSPSGALARGLLAGSPAGSPTSLGVFERPWQIHSGNLGGNFSEERPRPEAVEDSRCVVRARRLQGSPSSRHIWPWFGFTKGAVLGLRDPQAPPRLPRPRRLRPWSAGPWSAGLGRPGSGTGAAAFVE